jgi:chromosome partitioning protein
MIISVVNQKGGVGKTTTAVNLAAVLAVMNKKILLIDLDPQGNSSSGLGIEQSKRVKTMYNVLAKNETIESVTVQTELPNLSVVTSNMNLVAVEEILLNKKNAYYILKDSLITASEEFDYIIIDCPPALSLLTLNALVASHEVIIPMLCDFYSLEGLSHLLKTIEKVEKNFNAALKIAGILFTMYDKRSRLTEYVEKDVRSCLGNLVFNTVIPRNVKLAEAPSHGKAAIIYDYKCSGSMAYIELAKEFIARKAGGKNAK